MKTLFVTLLFSAHTYVYGSQQYGEPEEIPEAGHIRIDGKLSEWRNIDWTPLPEIIDGNPAITKAEWAIRWNDDPALFIAVRYVDPEFVLKNGYAGTHAQDCVEIFVRADTGSSPEKYAATQSSAQNYIFGLAPDKKTVWKKLAGADRFPQHNPATAAITVDGDTINYEIMVPLYDRFDSQNRRRVSKSEPVVEMEIGVDILIIDAGTNGYRGTVAENLMDDKRNNAGHIAVHTLAE
ncbi:MAG: sugar-binding protein [Kiritimatiellales bacterium]